MNNTEPKGTPAEWPNDKTLSTYKNYKTGAMRNVELVRENYSDQTVTINKFLAMILMMFTTKYY